MLVASCAAPSGTLTVSPSASDGVPPSGSATPTAVASAPPTRSASPALPSTSAVPDFPNIWIIVLENHGYDQVVGSPDMPYLNGLMDRYGLARRSSGVSRPSQPNYLALFSGSTHDVHDNDPHDIDAPTVADQIEASGGTWKEYAENRPPGCFTGATASGGRDGDGGYRRKHAPAISFDAIRNDPARCSDLVDLTAFRPEAADFSLIVPNQCHAAHDCGLGDADRWLAGFVPRIVDSPAFAAGGLLIVTFDEDSGNDPDGGHIATVVASVDVPAGFRSDEPHDHYGVLRTIEDAWGLDCLASACDARPLDEFFAAP
jgi:phosphatidylinositol-3-phosphatase